MASNTLISPLPPSPPPPPRARKPPLKLNTDPTSSPQVNRISRPPNVPGIYEDDEPSPSTSDQEHDKPPSPVLRKTKPKPRLSASRLPLPSRVASPPPLLPQTNGFFQAEFDAGPILKPKKPSRRQSGLLGASSEALSVPRAPSPAFGSPIRRAAGLAEEEEEMAVVTGQLVDVEEDVDVEYKPPPKKERRKSRGKEREATEELEVVAESSKPRERKRKERMEAETDGGGKPRLQDVTNPRAALISIDNTGAPCDNAVVRDMLISNVTVPMLPAARTFLSTSPTPSAPTSRGSSSPAPPGEGESTGGGRERRTRKSVNYAEPKLNTYVPPLPHLFLPPYQPLHLIRKMRKPDPPPGTTPAPLPKKRASAAAILGTYRLPEDAGNEADNDTEARSSLELPLRMNGTAIDPESFPLPPSRPTSAASLFSPPPPRSSVKRKKSRPVMEDEESDGDQADAEVGLGGMNTWVNVDARRRVGTSGSGSVGRERGALDDSRRHSMAV
ncbi:hypothetical protein C0991_009393 [Blastosporella zonata]|nr:hypothetical protein C0991_009393 [Blastosporella zonata]